MTHCDNEPAVQNREELIFLQDTNKQLTAPVINILSTETCGVHSQDPVMCRFLPQAEGDWSRAHYPHDWGSDSRTDWLLTGNGNMIRSSSQWNTNEVVWSKVKYANVEWVRREVNGSLTNRPQSGRLEFHRKIHGRPCTHILNMITGK